MAKHLPEKTWKLLWKIKPVAAVDCIVIKDKKILLVKRSTNPFKGWWCLPGGIMNVGETAEHAALRELKEETGATGKIISLVGVYSGPKRDPRGTTMTAAYLIKVVKEGQRYNNEVSEIKLFPINKMPSRLAFDHKQMIKDALKLLQSKGRKKS